MISYNYDDTTYVAVDPLILIGMVKPLDRRVALIAFKSLVALVPAKHTHMSHPLLSLTPLPSEVFRSPLPRI